MIAYIAMLRGINVGGNKRVKMDKLRATCGSLGLDEVKTYIQSGNIVFRSEKLSAAVVANQLSAGIERDFGFSADVIVRSREELGRVIKGNPLLKENDADPSKFHVVFLANKPAAFSVSKLAELTLAPDRVRFLNREIYFYFPNGVSGSSIWKHPLDRMLGVTGTMRNWNTVNKLYEMAQELG
jgi:uncharacterized protein (DUF1697 family)